MERLFDRRACDSCDTEECNDCDQKTGRREYDLCPSHEGMVLARKESENFRLIMKAGIAVSVFFLSIFMVWIAESTESTADDLDSRQEKFEKETILKQNMHTESVDRSLKIMERQVRALVEASQEIKSNTDVLVETTKFERQRAAQERKDNRDHIEHLERKQIERELKGK